MKIAAIALIALGILALAYQGFTYTKKDTAVDLGALKIVTEEKKTIPLPPVIGAVAIIAGVLMLVAGKKSS